MCNALESSTVASRASNLGALYCRYQPTSAVFGRWADRVDQARSCQSRGDVEGRDEMVRDANRYSGQPVRLAA